MLIYVLVLMALNFVFALKEYYEVVNDEKSSEAYIMATRITIILNFVAVVFLVLEIKGR